MFFLGFIIPLFALMFESYPRLVNRKFGVDIWTHLLYLAEYRKQKGIPKKINNGFLVPGSYDYPPAFIFIMSKFPDWMVRKYEFLFSPIFDSIHILIIFYVSYLFTQNIYVSLLTQLLYVVTPIVVLENSSATPRSLGYTLFSLTFLLLYYYQISHDPFVILSAIAFGSLIFLSHRFTTQGFLFYSLVFTMVFRSFDFLSVFVVSLLVSLVISKGFYLKVLGGHIGNLKFWYKVIEFRFYHQIKGAGLKSKSNDFVFNLYNQFLKFPPFILAITNPWIIASLYFLVFDFPTSFQQQYLLLWVTLSYVLAIVTLWIPKLRFLGEGQRYLELSAFPAAFLSAQLLINFVNKGNSLIIALYTLIATLCLVTIIVIQRKAIIKDTLRTITPDLEQMFSYLKKLKRKPKLLCIPHQITTNVIYHTGCPVFVNADYTSIDKIKDVYPFMRLPVERIMNNYGLDKVLLNTEYATIDDLKLKKYSIEKQIGNYLLIKV